MPGGHCPIVRPHHHHQTKKNKPRVGDPLEKSLSPGTDAHTKQAPFPTEDHNHTIETQIGWSRSSIGHLCAQTCTPVYVYTYTYTRDAHTHAAQVEKKKKDNPRIVTLRVTILGLSFFFFSTCLLGVRSAQ